MKKNKSFVRFCVKYLTIYSLVLFVLFLIINSFINKSLMNVSLDITSLLDYEEELKEDNFSSIPLKKYQRNEIYIFDEQDKIIFKTNNYEKNIVTKNDLIFINNYLDNTYFHVQKFTEGNQSKYLITKNHYGQNNFELTIIDYVIIDENYNILKGNMFKDKIKLTEHEFRLLKSGMNGKSYVSKYVYKNNEGLNRTLVFFEKDLTIKEYKKITNQILYKWALIIPFVLLFGSILIIIFYKKIKKSIYVMNQKILNLNYDDKIDKNIPIEFSEFSNKMKELLKKLKEEKRKREQEEETRKSIITNLSHDIKTPLTVIEGYSKAFCDGVVPKNKEKQYMRAIYDKAILSDEILNSLFLYSQMEQVEFKLNLQKLNFTEFCLEYLAIKYTDLELLKYKLNIDVEDKDIFLDFDPFLMKRVFDNIINNCVKHNKENTIIYFGYKIYQDRIEIKIKDNGVGLKKDNIDDLFKPFVTQSKSRNTGTGLGLYIAKKIVDLHKGKIKIEKNPEKPYNFEINIIFFKP